MMLTKLTIRPDHAIAFALMLAFGFFLVFDPSVALADWGANTATAYNSLNEGLENRAKSVWNTGRTIFYIVACIGILVCATLAVFGRFKWSHLFALIGGVILVAAASLLIQFLGGNAV